MTQFPHRACRPLKALTLALSLAALAAPALAEITPPTPTTPPAAATEAAPASRLPPGRLAFLGSAPNVSFWIALDDQVRTGDRIDITMVMIFEPMNGPGRYVADRMRFDCKALTEETLSHLSLGDSGAIEKDYGPLPVAKIDPNGVVMLVATAACSGNPGRGPILADAATARAAFIAANAKGRTR